MTQNSAKVKKKIGITEGSTIQAEPLNIVKARGAYLWDVKGDRYVDFFSQTWSMPIGHNHPAVIEAVKKQLDKVTHLRTAYTTDEKIELGELLVENSPEGMTKVNYTLHGSLAVEGAMKLAINNHEDRDKILYIEDGFHGRSLATMGISWKGGEPKYSNYYKNGIEVKKDLKDIEEKMIAHKPAGIILEIVQGNTGFKILSKEFVHGIRALCDKYDVAMIVDEIQTGFGCVKELFLCKEYDVVPDVITFGKGIGGGFPLAGVVYKEKFAFRSGEHSFTFAHNPISFTASVVAVKEMLKEGSKVEALNRLIVDGLNRLKEKYSFVTEARVMGTKGAIDIEVGDKKESCELSTYIVTRMLEEKIIISASRYRELGNSIMLQAPLVMKKEDVEAAFDTLDMVLSEVKEKLDKKES